MNVTLSVISLFLLIQTPGFSQPPDDRIRVSDDIHLIRLSPNAYLHVSVSEMPGYGQVSSNGLVLIEGGEAFLFDTPVTGGQTEMLFGFITDSLHASVVGFVPNHWHADCMGGLEYLHRKGVKSYAHQMTLDMAGEKGLPVPRQGFKDSLSLQLHDTTIECYYLGGGHSADNIVVWIPSEKILFAGCMVKDMGSEGLGNLSDAVIGEWPETIRKAMEKFPSAGIVIPGHGQYGGKELLFHTGELLAREKQ